jgi:hypothetical protein
MLVSKGKVDRDDQSDVNKSIDAMEINMDVKRDMDYLKHELLILKKKVGERGDFATIDDRETLGG